MNNNESEKLKQLRERLSKVAGISGEYVKCLKKELQEEKDKLAEETKSNVEFQKLSEKAIEISNNIARLEYEIQCLEKLANHFRYYDMLQNLRDAGYERFMKGDEKALNKLIKDLSDKLKPLCNFDEDKAISALIDKHSNELMAYEDRLNKAINNITYEIDRIESQGKSTEDLESQREKFGDIVSAIEKRKDYNVESDLNDLCESTERISETVKDSIKNKYMAILDRDLAEEFNLAEVNTITNILNTEKFKEWFAKNYSNLNYTDVITRAVGTGDDEKETNKEEIKTTKVEEEIKLEDGCSLDDAVNKLLEAKENGESVYCIFNGIVLHSDTVTLDSAYLKVFGMTKAELDDIEKLKAEHKEQEEERKRKEAEDLEKKISEDKKRKLQEEELKRKQIEDNKKKQDDEKKKKESEDLQKQIAEDKDKKLKEQLEEEENKKHLKLIQKIVAVALGSAIIIGLASTSCSKKQDSSTNDSLDNGTSNSDDATMDNETTLDDEQVIDNYIEERRETYEYYMNRYNLTEETAVDYVNRAYSIQATGFYDDATTIDDIIKVVMAFDTQGLMYTTYAEQSQGITTVLNRITNNYLLGTISDEDINAVTALKYFAKEGTDNYNFLNNFATLLQNLLENPNDKQAKSDMFDYLNIFAHSVDGFVSDKSCLTDDDVFNENAIVENFSNWIINYVHVIKPIYGVITTYSGDTLDIEVKVWSLDIDANKNDYYSRSYYVVDNYNSSKELQELFTEEEYEYLRRQNLQYLMETALEDPRYEELCNKYTSETIEINEPVSSIYSGTSLDEIVYSDYDITDYSRSLRR